MGDSGAPGQTGGHRDADIRAGSKQQFQPMLGERLAKQVVLTEDEE